MRGKRILGYFEELLSFNFIKEIPCAVDDLQDNVNASNKVTEKKKENDEELKIAWRYQNQPKVQVH